ncbi:MAG: ATP-binding cassette domain-containing protein [Planctomycetota bacterium]
MPACTVGPRHSAAWSVTVNREIRRTAPDDPQTGAVAAMFGLAGGHTEPLYDDLELTLSPGQIVAVTGPSGAGKSVLLGEVARQVPSVPLAPDALAGETRSAVALLDDAPLSDKLETLSRCGLADAAALITPAGRLSGGQRYRLALAVALHRARRNDRPTVVIADEFAAMLDAATAAVLSRQVRKLICRSNVALLLATPRAETLGPLQPDRVLVKPLGEPVREGHVPAEPAENKPQHWPVEPGTIHDYHRLGHFHYLAGPPATHKRVYVIPTPAGTVQRGGPELAAVLVVSPPLLSVRGRNLATAGRYAGTDRTTATELLNAEVECISRVVVHPIYRGCGLAVRLVRHALATAGTPVMEALAAMGAVHPFFAKAGMQPWHVPPDLVSARLLSAAEVVGLSGRDVAAVGPVRKLLARRDSPAAGFLQREIDECMRKSYRRRGQMRTGDPLAELCRRACRQYVYYIATDLPCQADRLP